MNPQGKPVPRVAYLLADPGIAYWESGKGSPVHARSMVRAFGHEGCSVDVLAMRLGKPPLADYPAQMPARGVLRHQWQKRILPITKDVDSAGSHTWRNWATAVDGLLAQRDFRRAAHKMLRPDFIYARHAWLAYSYARMRRAWRVPLVLEVNAVFGIEKAVRGELAMPGRTARIEREAFAAADLILPVSAAIKTQIEALGIAPEKIVVAPNAVDLDEFAPRSPAPAEGGWPADRFLIGSASSFRAYHGTATLLRATASLKDEIPTLGLRLIGAGAQWKEMRALAAELGIAGRVEFTGNVPHEQVAALLRECDACAAPYEGEHNQYNCPMKLFEYMALETPIVASAWGEIPQIVRNGETALLHRPGDAEALAGAIRQLYADPSAARRRAIASRERVAAHHTWRATARLVLQRFNIR